MHALSFTHQNEDIKCKMIDANEAGDKNEYRRLVAERTFWSRMFEPVLSLENEVSNGVSTS